MVRKSLAIDKPVSLDVNRFDESEKNRTVTFKSRCVEM